MKIKTKKRSYGEVASIQPQKHKKPRRQSAFSTFHNVLILL